MKKYLRLGEIPKNERSFKFNKITWDQRDQLSDCDDIWSEVETSIKYCNSWKGYNIEELFEKGVSVFEIDENNKPILNNKNLEHSYMWRSESSAYIVTGDEVGKGEDGEPIIKNVKIIEKL